MSNQDSNGGGGLVRDGATQTGRAVILIVVAIVVAVVLLHHSKPSTLNASTTKSAGGTTGTTLPSSPTTVPASGTTTPTSAPATTSGPTVPVANVKVLVLNGASFSQAIAGEFTAKLKTMGYNTLTPNNATATVQQTAIYVVTHGFAPEANALAASLGMPASAVKTQLPSGPPLPSGIPGTGANLVLLVGPDLAANGASSTPGTTAPPAGTTPPASGTTAPSPGTTAPSSSATTAPRGRT
jgi:hypothetical protein